MPPPNASIPLLIITTSRRSAFAERASRRVIDRKHQLQASVLAAQWSKVRNRPGRSVFGYLHILPLHCRNRFAALSFDCQTMLTGTPGAESWAANAQPAIAPQISNPANLA